MEEEDDEAEEKESATGGRGMKRIPASLTL
jgi:hypothetical protein